MNAVLDFLAAHVDPTIFRMWLAAHVVVAVVVVADQLRKASR